MSALNPPFRADQVGSMLRPPQIVEARQRHRASEMPDAELRAIEDAAIRDIVAVQEAIGLKSICSMRRCARSWPSLGSAKNSTASASSRR